MSQPTCGAPTKVGAACRAFVPPGRTVCVSHDPAMAAMVKAAQIKGGTAAAKLRLLQGALAGTVAIDTARTIGYLVSVQLKAIEQARQSDVETMLAEVRQLTAEARMRGRA